MKELIYRGDCNMEIRNARDIETKKALDLVWKVFLEFEAYDYVREGIDEFYNFINGNYINTLEIYGAYENRKIIGIIATRNEGNHIALFFVDGKYQQRISL